MRLVKRPMHLQHLRIAPLTSDKTLGRNQKPRPSTIQVSPMTIRRPTMVPKIRVSSPIERYTTTSLILQQGTQGVGRGEEVLTALLPGAMLEASLEA